MPGEVNSIFTKTLIPFIEREVGPDGVQAILRTAGRSREYLMADHNWISLALATQLVRVSMELMGEPDEERWARRLGEDGMNWKPREERSYIGTYTMAIGSPQGVYERIETIYSAHTRFYTVKLLDLGRGRATLSWTPAPGYVVPLWICACNKVALERFPTNWGLPRARLIESRCAAKGAHACLWDVRWKNPSLGPRFWWATAAGAAVAAIFWSVLGRILAVPGPVQALASLPLAVGVTLGIALREIERRRHMQRMLDLQSDEIIYSNRELDGKFRALEGQIETIEELSRGLEDKVRIRTEQLRTSNEDLQAAYRDLQTTQMQLVQREKMASVGQLVAGVAHELNNPIGFVYSNVGTLEDFVRRLRGMLELYRSEPLPDAQRERLQGEWDTRKIDYALKYLDSMTQGIKEGAERARKIVRDLRVFARSQDEVWQPVDLHEELDSSLTLLNHLLKDRVTVHRKLGDLPAVECIRSQIDQVFLNLLANAAQAIAGPGALTIETRSADGFAVVAIADSGPGIPAEVIGRVFDPFFTTKPVGEGTGLGLSISYEIAKKHGGDLRAESPAGAGAVFTLRLPLTRTGRP